MVILTVSQTIRTVGFIAVHAVVAVFTSVYEYFTPITLTTAFNFILYHHIIMINFLGTAMALHAVVLDAETKSFLKSPVQDQLVREVIDDSVAEVLQLVKVQVFYAVVIWKVAARVFFVANLAHYQDLSAFGLDVGFES
jgi:hypothetical protein